MGITTYDFLERFETLFLDYLSYAFRNHSEVTNVIHLHIIRGLKYARGGSLDISWISHRNAIIFNK